MCCIELEEGVIEAENCESNLLAELTDAFQSLSVTTFCQPRKQTKVTPLHVSPCSLWIKGV